MSSIVSYKDTLFQIFYPLSDITEKEIIVQTIKKGRIWEEKIVKLFEKHIKKDSVVLDIGAYIGTHTVCLSKIVGENGKVFSFEPQKSIYKCLDRTIQKNNLMNVYLFNNAVSNNKNIVQFTETTNGRASMTHMRPKLRDFESKVNVKCLTIDSLNLDQCDFIKIDVECCELLVLEGATETIKRHKPIILIECFDIHYKKLLTILEKLEYEIIENLPQMNYLCKGVCL